MLNGLFERLIFSTDESKSEPDLSFNYYNFFFFFFLFIIKKKKKKNGGGVACGNTFRYTFGMFSNTIQ